MKFKKGQRVRDELGELEILEVIDLEKIQLLRCKGLTGVDMGNEVERFSTHVMTVEEASGFAEFSTDELNRKLDNMQSLRMAIRAPKGEARTYSRRKKPAIKGVAKPEEAWEEM